MDKSKVALFFMAYPVDIDVSNLTFNTTMHDNESVSKCYKAYNIYFLLQQFYLSRKKDFHIGLN